MRALHMDPAHKRSTKNLKRQYTVQKHSKRVTYLLFLHIKQWRVSYLHGWIAIVAHSFDSLETQKASYLG